jgi:predicted ATPase
MNLKGVEFRDFACFESCFVPIDTGIRILAGKNNSGKTALLRGLNALRALPFEGTSAMDSGIQRYARIQSPYPTYALNIWCEYEGNDSSFFGDGVVGHRTYLQAREFKWKFVLQAFPQAGAIDLQRINLVCDGQDLPIMDAVAPGSNLVQLHYASNGTVARRTGFSANSSGQALPNGKQLYIYRRVDICSAVAALMNNRMVAAHRVVRPSLNIQALDALSDSADSLAPFLDTLQSNNRDKFIEIEKVVTGIFPEFRQVNPHKTQNEVSIVLTKKDSQDKIPLTHCGTGVEQILSIATFVLTTPPGNLLLLDEPHSYLHPTAERQLSSFLLAHPEHRYVITTHSAILINSVSPDRVLSVSDTGPTATSTQLASILQCSDIKTPTSSSTIGSS